MTDYCTTFYLLSNAFLLLGCFKIARMKPTTFALICFSILLKDFLSVAESEKLFAQTLNVYGLFTETNWGEVETRLKYCINGVPFQRYWKKL